MTYFVIVLIDQALVSLASYLLILNIITELDGESSVAVLQLISIGMISYPLLNGILCFRIIESKDEIPHIFLTELLWIGLMVIGAGVLMLLLFGWGAFLGVGLTLFLVNVLSHILRMVALSRRSGPALLWSSVVLVLIVLALGWMITGDYPAAYFLLPIIAGRFFQALLSYLLTPATIALGTGAASSGFDRPRFLAAVTQYGRTNALFWLFSFSAPTSVAVELRIIDMCLAPVRQLSASLQNYLIPRSASTKRILLVSILAAVVLSPASIVLLTFFDLALDRFKFLAVILAGATACILLSNAALIQLRMRAQHGLIWRVIIVALLGTMPLALALTAYAELATGTIIVLEAAILAMLIFQTLRLRERINA